MALTAPIDTQVSQLSTEDVHGSEIVVRRDDLKRVRLYLRLAAALQALSVALLALVGYRLAIRLFGLQSGSSRTLLPLLVVFALAALYYLRAELRSRSYRIELTADAVVFEYGGTRSYVPREHIQLFDTESSLLLRRFGLKRSVLHTGGGMVVVSPVPGQVASAIEGMILAQPATRHAGTTDGDA